MADMSIVPVKGIVPVKMEAVEKFDGMENVTPDIPVIKHCYMARLFDFGEQRLEEINAMIAIYRGGVRRNYESEFDPQNPVSPTCYSTDGESGSHIEGTVILGDKPRRIYGNCKSCFYAQFGTAGIWKGPARAGVQCSEYSLLFILLESGIPAVLQIPPSSTRYVKSDITNAVSQIPNANLRNIVWKFLPTGGGKRKTAIKVVPARAASMPEIEAVAALRTNLEEWAPNFVEQFASGGSIELLDEEGPVNY